MADFGTYVAGQVLTAAELNAAGAWTTYTPTWTNLTVGNATQSFRYSKFNKIGFVQGELTFGTTTSITAANVRVSLPSGWTMPNNPLASFSYFLDNGVADFFGWTVRWDDTNLFINVGNAAGTYLQGGGLSATAPFTWGNTDLMRIGAIVRLS
jgi:hypothetical protein